MVQKQSPKARGRPRKYDPQQARASAMAVFWRNGFAATSLDDLSDATGMNRPSLYHAFGNKRRLYLSLLDEYILVSSETIRAELATARPLNASLRGLFRRVLSLYRTSAGLPYGCFLMGTAVTEAAADNQVRARLAAFLEDSTRTLKQRFQMAQRKGEISAQADVTALAEVAAALLQSLGVRSRAGDSRSSLLGTVDSVVALICGTGSERRQKKRGKRA